MGFGRATLPVAIPQWVKNETGDTGIQPQPGFRTVVQAHATAPISSALTQSPREACRCFVPQDWFGGNCGCHWARSGSAKALRGWWGHSQPQCPAVHLSVPTHTSMLTWPIQRCIHVSLCMCAPVSTPPAHHCLCPHTMGLHPQAPTFTHPRAHSRGGMAVPRGAVTPGKGWDVSALPPPCCAGPRGERGWGRWLYWGDSPRESPESSTRAGQGGGGCVPVLGSAYSQGHTVTQWSGRAAGSCWWQGCPLALEEPLG